MKKQKETKKQKCPYCKVSLGRGSCDLCKKYMFVLKANGKIMIMA